MDGTKGELLIISAPDLELDVVIKSSVFILPIGNNLYKVGATYDWKDKTNIPTEQGKQELVEKLKKLFHVILKLLNILEEFAQQSKTEDH